MVRQLIEETIHIIGAFEAAIRGSERAALVAAQRLATQAPVRVWSTVPPTRPLASLATVQGVHLEAIRPFAGAMPRGGRLIIWGTHYDIGVWMRAAAPRAVAIVCELIHHAALYRAVLDVRAAGLAEPRVVYASSLLRDAALLDGEAIFPPADLAPMLALARDREADRAFTVCRVSRDDPAKHHAGDPALYEALAAEGVRVRILGGTCLAGTVAPSPLIELMPEGSVAVADLLSGADVFFYRTGGAGVSVDSAGLVVAEAMAAALPVVAGFPGGYTDLIEDGVNGFIVDGDTNALAAIRRLAADPHLRLRLGMRARARVVDYFGADYARRFLRAAFGH